MSYEYGPWNGHSRERQTIKNCLIVPSVRNFVGGTCAPPSALLVLTMNPTRSDRWKDLIYVQLHVITDEGRYSPNSSRTVPMMNGTRVNSPRANRCLGLSRMTRPSTFGRNSGLIGWYSGNCSTHFFIIYIAVSSFHNTVIFIVWIIRPISPRRPVAVLGRGRGPRPHFLSRPPSFTTDYLLLRRTTHWMRSSFAKSKVRS